jgi:vacuolar-type H+-ATPase subunit F/Vma7
MPEELTRDNTFVIMGEEDLVIGFGALGFKVYALKEPGEFQDALEEVVREKAGICLVQENFYVQEQEKINSYKKLPLPIFIPFAKDVKTDLLESIVKDIRIRATGAL